MEKAIQIKIEKKVVPFVGDRMIEKEYKKNSINDNVVYDESGTLQNPSIRRDEEKIYELCQIVCPERKELVLYYVPVNEKKMFEDLISVSLDFINREVRDQVSEIIYIKRLKKKVVIADIKNLPWWKRLFNLF
jgi:hypothetical protein